MTKSSLVMFPAQLKAVSQAMLCPIRPGQSHSLNTALAQPQILESQSLQLRLQLLGTYPWYVETGEHREKMQSD